MKSENSARNGSRRLPGYLKRRCSKTGTLKCKCIGDRADIDFGFRKESGNNETTAPTINKIDINESLSAMLQVMNIQCLLAETVRGHN